MTSDYDAAYLHRRREEREDCSRILAGLENGSLHLKGSAIGSDWVDEGPKLKSILGGMIAEIDREIANLVRTPETGPSTHLKSRASDWN